MASAEREELLQALVDYFPRETRAEWRRFYRLLEATDLERLESPECIAEAKRSFASVYAFEDEGVKLREEDDVGLLCLDTGAETEAVVADIDTTAKTIRVRAKSAKLPERCFIAAEPRMPNHVAVRALEQIAADPDRYPLANALLDRRATVPDAPSIVEAALALEDGFFTVQGPPGTGKTYTGAHVVVALVAAGKRVAIMAQSHYAINQLCRQCERVAEQLGQPFKGIKASSKERDKLRGKMLQDTEGQFAVRAARVPVAAGTLWQIAALPANSFDYVIFDEAGQLSLAAVIAASRCAKRAILLGDHMQLPMVSQAPHPGAAGASILEHLMGDRRVIAPDAGFLLRETRRMNADLTRFISELCYDGQLASHATAATRGRGEPSVIFREVIHHGREQVAPEEVAVVAELVRAYRQTLSPEQIVVLTPYRAQENALRAAIGREARIGTVDRLQGQEGEVAIYSLASSDADHLGRDVEFLLSVNRMNVALSRARTQAVLICSPGLFRTKPESLEIIRLLNALCLVRAHHRRSAQGSS